MSFMTVMKVRRTNCWQFGAALAPVPLSTGSGVIRLDFRHFWANEPPNHAACGRDSGVGSSNWARMGSSPRSTRTMTILSSVFPAGYDQRATSSL